MKNIYSLLSIFFCTGLMAQNTIVTDSVLQLGPCAGSQVIVKYHTTGSFPTFGNVFTAQLSNAFGQFTNPVSIGTSSFNLGFVFATLPANATFGFLYRVRVISSNPAVTGSQSPNTVIITSNQFVANISAIQGTLMCPGDSKTLQVLVPANSYSWSTGATTQSIVITQPGIYSVKVKDMLGCESKDTLKISLDSKCDATNISESAINSLKYFPNPVHCSGAIKVQNESKKLFFLITVEGRVQPIATFNGVIDLSGYYFKPGIYILQMISENGNSETAKIILTE